MSQYKFKLKTHEAYYFKVLAELLSNNLKTACFEISQDNIKLSMMDHHRKTLISLLLDSENFSIYKLNQQTIFMGLNLNHFHKMLKSIKKKDKLELNIKKNNDTELAIKSIPKENTRVTTSYIKIQKIQHLDIDIPTGYKKPIIVLSSEFQKMCKDIANIGNLIKVECYSNKIRFNCDAGGILKRNVEFGEDDEDDEHNNKILTTQTFQIEQFTRIIKISGLSNFMHIYVSDNLPILFKSSVGGMGKISIYIKSNELLDKERHEMSLVSEE